MVQASEEFDEPKPDAIRTPIARRAFLGGLLCAAGCGGVAENAKVAEQPRRNIEPLATKTPCIPRLEESGIRPKLLGQVRDLMAQPQGMFLCCSPVGRDITKTLYACLREIDPHKKKIMTVEDPIECPLDNVTQLEINTKGSETFASGLRSIVRQSPDVIMIGELRDLETAAIACQAATTGDMVFSSVHANDTSTAVFQLLDLGVEPSLLASALSAVLAHRLVRVLCENCKEPYKPKPEFLKKAHLPADKIDVFFRTPVEPQTICTQCGGVGYRGQTGIFELMVITDPMRDILRENPSLKAIKLEARKNGMIYMQEDGLRQVISGKTSITELLRSLTDPT